MTQKNSNFAKKAGCEFCYLIAPSSTRALNESILPLTQTGKYQVELTCMFPPNVGSRCPTVLKNIKEKWRKKALSLGDNPTQYANTPSCDLKGNFGDRWVHCVLFECLLCTSTSFSTLQVFLSGCVRKTVKGQKTLGPRQHFQSLPEHWKF